MASIKRVGTIALALGPARTRNELLPFLQGGVVFALKWLASWYPGLLWSEFCEGDNDEGQTAIADQLGDFVEVLFFRPYEYVFRDHVIVRTLACRGYRSWCVSASSPGDTLWGRRMRCSQCRRRVAKQAVPQASES